MQIYRRAKHTSTLRDRTHFVNAVVVPSLSVSVFLQCLHLADHLPLRTVKSAKANFATRGVPAVEDAGGFESDSRSDAIELSAIFERRSKEYICTMLGTGRNIEI